MNSADAIFVSNPFSSLNLSLANLISNHGILFNGVDDGIWIGPAGVQRLIAGDGVTNATWKDVDPKNLICPTIHQKRIWAVETGTNFGWYLPPDQVYGDATKFDFGPLFKMGGKLVGLTTWTVDDGDGSDDNLVAISSNGEIAIYAGIDPSGSATWQLKGVYRMGPPVAGNRFWERIGGDVKFMTYQGLVSLNAMLTSTKTSPAQDTVEALKVQQPLSEAASALGTLAGWELYYSPELNMLIINVPSVTSIGSIQFVENLVNSKWCQFEGYDASCFCTFNGLPFFGGKNGSIYQAWSGNADNVTLAGSAGNYIEARTQQAYSYLDGPGINKHVGMYRPTFIVTSTVEYGSVIAYNFSFKTPAINFSPTSESESQWDSALWDAATWSGSLRSQAEWTQAEGIGVTASLCMMARAKAEVIWVSTDYIFQVGGPM